MPDVIAKEDVKRLVSCAEGLIASDKHSAIYIIKEVRRIEGCSLAEAKEAFCLAKNNETLGEYQERVILPFLEELEALEKESLAQ